MQTQIFPLLPNKQQRKTQSRFPLSTITILVVTFIAFVVCVILLPKMRRTLLIDATEQVPKTAQAFRKQPTDQPPANDVPFIVYRTAEKRIKACVVPRLCSVEPLINAGDQQFFVPSEYRQFSKVLRDCFPRYHVNLSFYDGQQPKFRDISTYDVDVVGRSMVALWHVHFAHFARFFIHKVLAPAAMFRGPGSSLPTPSCMYPGKDAQASCLHDEHKKLKPRILVSGRAYNVAWNNGLLNLLDEGAAGDALVHIVPNEQRASNASRMECYRAGLLTREVFDSDDASHDSLFRATGIQRAANCSQSVGKAQRPMHIVVVVRREGHKRSLYEDSLNALKTELPKRTDATVEWVRDLGKRNFREQMRLFQRADVLFCVHGAELGNILFMRKGAVIVEIMPFAFNPPYFVFMAERVHARIMSVASDPDVAAFERCLQTYPSDNKDNLLGKRFLSQVNEYRKATNMQQRTTVALKGSAPGRFAICARWQRIRFNATYVAEVLATQARQRCI